MNFGTHRRERSGYDIMMIANKHREHLRNVKPSIDNRPPSCIAFQSIRDPLKGKTAYIRKRKILQIEEQNNRMLKHIFETFSEYSVGKTHSLGPKSMNILSRKKEQYRINDQNTKFLNVLCDIKPSLQFKQLEKDYYQNLEYGGLRKTNFNGQSHNDPLERSRSMQQSRMTTRIVSPTGSRCSTSSQSTRKQSQPVNNCSSKGDSQEMSNIKKNLESNLRFEGDDGYYFLSQNSNINKKELTIQTNSSGHVYNSSIKGEFRRKIKNKKTMGGIGKLKRNKIDLESVNRSPDRRELQTKPLEHITEAEKLPKRPFTKHRPKRKYHKKKRSKSLNVTTEFENEFSNLEMEDFNDAKHFPDRNYEGEEEKSFDFDVNVKLNKNIIQDYTKVPQSNGKADQQAFINNPRIL